MVCTYQHLLNNDLEYTLERRLLVNRKLIAFGGLALASAIVTGIVYRLRKNTPTAKKSMLKSVSPSMFALKAKELGVEEAALRAVAEVESNNNGFYTNTKFPIVRLENHVLPRYQKTYNIPNKAFGSNKVGVAEYNRFLEAYRYNADSAINATSFGQFQIMGFHWKNLGYKSPQDFYTQMSKDANAQFDAFIRFISKNNLVQYLKSKEWAKFAYRYNGAGYRNNSYDTKLEASYKKWKEQLK